VKTVAEVFWDVTLSSDEVRYQHFGTPCCLHLQGEVKMEAARSSEAVVHYRNTTRRHNSDLDLNLASR
jgi:hypothetical protein